MIQNNASITRIRLLLMFIFVLNAFPMVSNANWISIEIVASDGRAYGDIRFLPDADSYLFTDYGLYWDGPTEAPSLFREDGKLYVASLAGNREPTLLFDGTTPQSQEELRYEVSPDGRFVVPIVPACELTVIEIETGRSQIMESLEDGCVTFKGFSSNSQYLVTVAANQLQSYALAAFPSAPLSILSQVNTENDKVLISADSQFVIVQFSTGPQRVSGFPMNGGAEYSLIPASIGVEEINEIDVSLTGQDVYILMKSADRGLYRVSPTGDGFTRLDPPSTEIQLGKRFKLSPDGNHFLIYSRNGSPLHLPAAGGALHGYGFIQSVYDITFSDNSEMIVLTGQSRDDRRTNLFRISLSDLSLLQISPVEGGASVEAYRITPNGDRVVYTIDTATREPSLFKSASLIDGTTFSLNQDQGLDENHTFELTNDGTSVIYEVDQVFYREPIYPDRVEERRQLANLNQLGEGRATNDWGVSNDGEYLLAHYIVGAPNAIEIDPLLVMAKPSGATPYFATTPITVGYQNEPYLYQIEFFDRQPADGTMVIGDDLPDWLTLTDNQNGTATLAGTPSVGAPSPASIPIKLRLINTQGRQFDEQSFLLTVIGSSELMTPEISEISDLLNQSTDIAISHPSTVSRSPNGETAVFVVEENNEYVLHSVSTSGDTLPIPLVRDEVWSWKFVPEQRALLYLSHESKYLYLVSLDGGPSTSISDGIVADYQLSPDRSHIVYVLVDNTFSFKSDFAIYARDLSNGVVGDPVLLGSGFGYGRLSFTPDGDRILYQLEGSSNGSYVDLFSAPLSGDGAVQINQNVGEMIYDYQISPNQQFVAYVGRESGGYSDLYLVPINGGERGQLNQNLSGSAGIIDDPADKIEQFAFTHDGESVVFIHQVDAPEGSRWSWEERLYLAPVSGAPPTLLAPLPSDDHAEYLIPRFELDETGRYLVYEAIQYDGNRQQTVVYSLDLEQGLSVTLRDKFESFETWELTPDGAYVILMLDDSESNSVQDLYSVPISGGPLIHLNGPIYPDGKSDVSSYQISPNHDWLVFVVRISYPNGDVFEELYTVPVKGGTPMRINAVPQSGDGAITAYQFVPNGSHIVYQSVLGSETKLESVSIFGGRVTRHSAPGVEIGNRGSFFVSPGSDQILFTASGRIDGVYELYRSPMVDRPFISDQPDRYLFTEERFSFPVAVSLMDQNKTLSIELVSKPDWLTWTDTGNGTGTFEGTPTEAQAGTYHIELIATDSAGGRMSYRFEFTVLSDRSTRYLPFVQS